MNRSQDKNKMKLIDEQGGDGWVTSSSADVNSTPEIATGYAAGATAGDLQSVVTGGLMYQEVADRSADREDFANSVCIILELLIEL